MGLNHKTNYPRASRGHGGITGHKLFSVVVGLSLHFFLFSTLCFLSFVCCKSIVYYNARSLLPKMDELAAMVSASRPAVVCIVETWLCDYILNSEICLPDYAII